MILATVLWIFVGTVPGQIIYICFLFLLCSIFNSGNGIAQTRYLLCAVPADKQNQINIINVMASISLGIAPLLGGLFLKFSSNWRFEILNLPLGNYQILFIISAVLFALPHMLTKGLKQRKDTPTLHVLAIATRPLLRTMGPFLALMRRRPANRPNTDLPD